VFEERDPAGAARLFDLPAGAGAGAWLATAGGMWHLVLATEAPIDRLVPDMAAMVADRTTAVVRPVDDHTLHVRVFVGGIGEDPGTGSAAGPIALLARRLWGTDADVTIRQGDEMGRPCRLEVHAEPGAITVGGRVTACAEGHFTL
jgi:predicted PhzF superfamily epimerase YddE/YHI9